MTRDSQVEQLTQNVTLCSISDIPSGFSLDQLISQIVKAHIQEETKKVKQSLKEKLKVEKPAKGGKWKADFKFELLSEKALEILQEELRKWS